MPAKHIALVANKWWEANPLCSVLVDDRARPAEITNFEILNYPTFRPRPAGTPDPIPRLSFECGNASVDVWCIEELMDQAVSSSSSLEKARVLPPALASRTRPDLVVAFGTAGTRSGVAANGGVVIGRRVFVHDPLADQIDRQGLWTPPVADEIVDSAFDLKLFRGMSVEWKYRAEARFISAPVTPGTPPLVFPGNGFVSLGVVNITNYDQYAWADQTAIDAFNAAEIIDGQIGSIETTHCIIRASSDAPFLFVSGIVDMEGLFDYQVTPRVYGQNVVGAHNAAVAAAFLVPELARVLSAS